MRADCNRKIFSFSFFNPRYLFGIVSSSKKTQFSFAILSCIKFLNKLARPQRTESENWNYKVIYYNISRHQHSSGQCGNEKLFFFVSHYLVDRVYWDIHIAEIAKTIQTMVEKMTRFKLRTTSSLKCIFFAIPTSWFSFPMSTNWEHRSLIVS